MYCCYTATPDQESEDDDSSSLSAPDSSVKGRSQPHSQTMTMHGVIGGFESIEEEEAEADGDSP